MHQRLHVCLLAEQLTFVRTIVYFTLPWKTKHCSVVKNQLEKTNLHLNQLNGNFDLLICFWFIYNSYIVPNVNGSIRSLGI